MYAYLQHIPQAFLLNPWKHHLGFIRSQLPELRKLPAGYLKKQLLDIGNSVTDFYTGDLSITEICNELKKTLIQTGHFSKAAYLHWLSQVSKYETLPVSDGSKWLMRPGNDERYIHIHPAKISSDHIRIKSRSIKSALLWAVYAPSYPGKKALELINLLRSDFLGLSPVKSISSRQAWLMEQLQD